MERNLRFLWGRQSVLKWNMVAVCQSGTMPKPSTHSHSDTENYEMNKLWLCEAAVIVSKAVPLQTPYRIKTYGEGMEQCLSG